MTADVVLARNAEKNWLIHITFCSACNLKLELELDRGCVINQSLKKSVTWFYKERLKEN